ncbi:GDYXXLXY domain-containing protein [Rossellomorea sp. NS-SX7]|uniref:GDYXXLXY domain-containing protein n=1 Tax=Rossellomorea sp. NS-SX7 TaxID=3463856 RepID=UPI00405A448B
MKKLISLTYLFGVVFLLASALYFFASNWQVFSRLEKVALAGSLIVLFYGATFLLERVLKGAHFLSNWLLVSGVISFGLSVALLGQLYNSHADSYLLFLVWSIPALLFSLYTRYNGFYALAHILIHLTIYFFLFPSSPFGHWTPAHTWIAFGVGIMNTLLFLIIKKGWIASKPLLYLSLASANLLFMVSAFNEGYPVFFSLFYIVILGVGVYRYVHKETSIFIILSMFGTGFIIIKMFELMARYVSSLFFVGLLLAAVLLLTGSVFLVNYLRKCPSSRHWTKTIFVASVTTIASVFIVASVFGLLSLFMVDVSMITLFILATVFVIPSTVTNWPSPVKYSLTMTGILIGMTASTFDDFSFAMFFVLAFVFYLEKRAAAKIVFYLLFQLNLGIFLGQTLEMGAHPLLAVMVLLNGAVFLAAHKRHVIQYGAFLIGILAFFSLTAIDLSLPLHMIYTALFFVTTTVCIYLFKKWDRTFYWVTSLVFWFMLIIQLYYDLAWKLVHKSLLFAVLGVLFMMTAAYLDRKASPDLQSRSILAGKIPGILLIIFLQGGWIGYSVYSNETLLQNGETILLELQPVDPRSLLQGDYVQLNYTISQLERTSIDDTGPITIVLRKNAQGIHEYTGVYSMRDGDWNTPYEKKPGDVLLNGKVTGSWDHTAQATYGIEHFFIPEGTGLDVEGKVKTAVVKVSDKGNGILVRLQD